MGLKDFAKIEIGFGESVCLVELRHEHSSESFWAVKRGGKWGRCIFLFKLDFAAGVWREVSKFCS